MDNEFEKVGTVVLKMENELILADENDENILYIKPCETSYLYDIGETESLYNSVPIFDLNKNTQNRIKEAWEAFYGGIY